MSWFSLLDEQDLQAHENASDPHIVYQRESERGQPNGYAGLDPSARVQNGVFATDDLIVADSSKGLVLRDAAGDYWRVSVSPSGSLATTNLGSSPP